MQNAISIQPKEEKIYILLNGLIEYNYCTIDGELFQSVAGSVEEAREACVEWILAK